MRQILHHLRHPCWISTLILILTTTTVPALAATPAWAPDAYALRYARTYKHFDGMKQITVAARYRLTAVGERLDLPRVSLWLDAGIGEFELGDDDSTVLSLGAAVQWDILPEDGGLYLEAGFAPTYVESTRYGDENLGGPLEFTSHLLLGWRPSGARGPFFGLRIHHISNGRIYDANPGADFVGVEVGWRP